MSRDLRILAAAAGLSALGDFMAVIPLIMHVQQSAGSAYAVSALVFALWGPVVLAAGLAAHGVKNVLLRTLIHERVPEALRGRAFAAYNGVRNAAELGALALGGVVVAAFGARPALLVVGVGPALIGLFCLFLLTTTLERRVIHARVEG